MVGYMKLSNNDAMIFDYIIYHVRIKFNKRHHHILKKSELDLAIWFTYLKLLDKNNKKLLIYFTNTQTTIFQKSVHGVKLRPNYYFIANSINNNSYQNDIPKLINLIYKTLHKLFISIKDMELFSTISIFGLKDENFYIKVISFQESKDCKNIQLTYL